MDAIVNEGRDGRTLLAIKNGGKTPREKKVEHSLLVLEARLEKIWRNPNFVHVLPLRLAMMAL